MDGGWLIKDGKCKEGLRICPKCDKKIYGLQKKHTCRICGECFHKACCMPEFIYNTAKDENGTSGPICHECWRVNFYGTADYDLETGYCPKLDGEKKPELARYPKACLKPDDFESLKNKVKENKLTKFKQFIKMYLKPIGPSHDINKEIQPGKEIESEQYSLWMKIQDDPETYEELSKKWFKQVMNIKEDVEISFNNDPSGMQTVLIVTTSDRIYLMKGATDIEFEIFNSIRGELFDVSPKMYNVGLFRFPMICFLSLLGLSNMSQSGLYDLNNQLNGGMYCFEFEKMTDYYDLEEDVFKDNETKLKELKDSYDELIKRSSVYGEHKDHQGIGHNVCVKVDGGKLKSYFIDMGSFNFTDKGSIKKRKKKKTKKRKSKKGKSKKGKSKKGKSKKKTRRK